MQRLQMCRLSVNKQLIHGRQIQIVDESLLNPHPQAGQQVHRFFGTDRSSTRQHTKGSGDLVMQFGSLVTHQQITNAAFPADDVRDNFLDFRDQLLFGFAQA